jgi:hypothetical protein
MEIGSILRYAGEHGPYLIVIALLLRSSAQKDSIIEGLSQKMLDIIHQTRGAAQAASAAVKVAKDITESN